MVTKFLSNLVQKDIQEQEKINKASKKDNDTTDIKKDFGPTEEELQEYSVNKELEIVLGDREDYEYPEDAIIAMAEYSGFGYEAEHAIRASWLRAVRNGEDPFKRASLLASLGYESLDADLLPDLEEEGNDNEQNSSFEFCYR